MFTELVISHLGDATAAGTSSKRVPRSVQVNQFFKKNEIFWSLECDYTHYYLLSQHPDQQRFLCMKPVFRFIPDKALAPFHNFIGNLLAAVCRETVEHPSIR